MNIAPCPRRAFADLNVASVLSWARMGRVELSGFPHVDQWLAGCLKRPAAVKAAARRPHPGGWQELLSVLMDDQAHRVEVFHGAQIADEPSRPARHIGGFRTGTQGVGHAVLMMPEIWRIVLARGSKRLSAQWLSGI